MVNKLARYAFTDAKDEPSTEKEVSLYDVMQAGLDEQKVTVELNTTQVKEFLESLPVDETLSNSKFYLTYEVAYPIPDGYLGVDFDIPNYYSGHTNARDLYLHLVYNDANDDVYYLPPGDGDNDHPVSFTDVVQIQNFLDTIVLPAIGFQAKDAIWQVNTDLTVTLWYNPTLPSIHYLYFIGGSSQINDYAGASYPAISTDYGHKESKIMINTLPSSGIASINGDSNSVQAFGINNDVSNSVPFINNDGSGNHSIVTNYWSGSGNNGIGNAYLGTNEYSPLRFKTDEALAMLIDEVQDIYIGDYQSGYGKTGKLTIFQNDSNPWNGLTFVNLNTAQTAGFYYDTGYNGLGVAGNGVIVGWFDTGNSGHYSSVSDRKLKENIIPITNSANIYKLKPVDFNFIKAPDKPQKGFIAQEVKEVYPELVSGTDTLGLNMAGLIPMLVAEVQKLRAELDELKTKK